MDEHDRIINWLTRRTADEMEVAAAEAITKLRAELAECKRDAERYRYLRNNISFYDVDHDFDVEGRNVPVLASVSECIWYHATDCLLRKLDEVVDAALAAKGE
mgnify:CR=1 FL=1